MTILNKLFIWPYLVSVLVSVLASALVSGAATASSQADNLAEAKILDSIGATTRDSSLWDSYDKILSQYLVKGEREGIEATLVDYAGLRNEPAFRVLLDQIRHYPLENLNSKAEKIAFYINTYNILTIQLILDKQPKNSIKEIGTFFRGPWDQVVLENELGTFTLDDIEHKIIRPLAEPRIHFAINCASLSCPDIGPEAYRASKLDAQLDAQVGRFLQQPSKGLRRQKDGLAISKIFQWYEEDFNESGGVSAFLKHYLPWTKGMSRRYIAYNWSLNR